MTRKKGLEAVRASLDSIFSPEGLKNIQLLREGTLSTLPEESFYSGAQDEDAETSAVAIRHDTLPQHSAESATQPVCLPPQSADSICCNNLPAQAAETTPGSALTTLSAETTQQDNLPPQVAPSMRAETVPSRLAPRSGARTRAQGIILNYLSRLGSHITNYPRLQAETGVPVRTIRDIFTKFEALGWMTKTPWAQGSARGIKILVHENCRYTSPIQLTDSTCLQAPLLQPAFTAPKGRSAKKLAFSTEDCRVHWPQLAHAGFGPDHLERIAASLSRLGKSADRVVAGLDHIEFELTHDRLVDENGQAVGDPCAWAFQILAQNGYYRRPKGYISPEEQALRDQEAEARALLAARKKVDQIRYEAFDCGN